MSERFYCEDQYEIYRLNMRAEDDLARIAADKNADWLKFEWQRLNTEDYLLRLSRNNPDDEQEFWREENRPT